MAEETKKTFVRANPALERNVKKLARLRAKRAAIESEEEDLVAQVKKAIGQGDGLEGKGFLITSKFSSSTAWKDVAIEAGAGGELIAKHTKKNKSPSLTYGGPMFKPAEKPAAAAA